MLEVYSSNNTYCTMHGSLSRSHALRSGRTRAKVILSRTELVRIRTTSKIWYCTTALHSGDGDGGATIIGEPEQIP